MSRSYTVQYTAKSFQLSIANREMLQQAECDIQVNSTSFFFSFSLDHYVCLGSSWNNHHYLCVLISYLGFHVQPLCSTFSYQLFTEFESIFFFLCRFGVSFSVTKYLLGCTGLYTLTCKLMVYAVAYYV